MYTNAEIINIDILKISLILRNYYTKIGSGAADCLARYQVSLFGRRESETPTPPHPRREEVE